MRAQLPNTRRIALLFTLLMLLPAAASARYTQFAINGATFCGLLESGQLECTSSVDPISPTLQPDKDTTYTQIEMGMHYRCGITTNGEIDCWGVNTHEGEIDPPSFDFPVVALSVGPYHACAVDNEGNIKCWGQNVHGQTEPMEPLNDYVDVDAFGIFNSCGVKSSGDALCWGRPGYYEIPSWINTSSASAVTNLETTGDIGCALRADGTADCWQRSLDNQSIAEFRSGPYRKILPLTESSRYPACALTFNGELDCAQGPTRSSRGIAALPLTITRLSDSYKDVHLSNQYLYGYTFDNRLVSISNNIGGPLSELVRLVNGDLTLPSMSLTDAEYYGEQAGVELFYNVLDLSAYQFRHKYKTQVLRDGEPIAISDGASSFIDTSVIDGNKYTYSIRAVHPFGLTGPASKSLAVNASTTNSSAPIDPPAGRPNAPAGLRAEVYWFDVELFWDRNFSGQVDHYEIRKNGEKVATTRGTSWYDNATQDGEMYQYDVLAVGPDNSLLGLDSVRVQIGASECN